MSPYQDLWFVGTDMGPLFRSIDRGASWQTVPTVKNLFFLDTNEDYVDLPAPGYSAIPDTVFHAAAGGHPTMSNNGGIDWFPIDHLATKTVRFWRPDSAHPGTVFAGLKNGLAVTRDNGCSWGFPATPKQQTPLGMFIDPADGGIYVAFADGIYLSTDGGENFPAAPMASPPPGTTLHRFAGGRKGDDVVLAYVLDVSTGNGAVYTGRAGGPMQPAVFSVDGVSEPLTGCEHVVMAENDTVVYAAGAHTDPHNMGTSVYKSVGGGTFQVVLEGGQTQPKNLSPSAVGLDIGYWDYGYYTFTVKQNDSSHVGGGQNFFLHLSTDGGGHWQSPFTKPVTTPPAPGGYWESTGLDNTSIRKLLFSPHNPKFGLACGCDRAVLITVDGGKTWRIVTDAKPDGTRIFPRNTCYDAVFDPDDPHVIYVATSDFHDFQHSSVCFERVRDDIDPAKTPHAYPIGGIYKSSDDGLSWTQLTGGDPGASTSFVSIAFNAKDDLLYCGTQGAGLATVKRDGTEWNWSTGLPENAIVPQIQADPVTGDMYALIGSDPKADHENWLTSGLYRRQPGKNWCSLRQTLIPPAPDISMASLMLYPTSFALVRGADSAVQMLLVTTADRCVVTGSEAAAGLWQCEVGKSGSYTWYQIQQYSYAYSVDLDPCDPKRIYLSGMCVPGEGKTYGALYADDPSKPFKTNCDLEVQSCLWSVTPDPNDPSQIFYACFGAGMRYGPKPNDSSNCNLPPGP